MASMSKISNIPFIIIYENFVILNVQCSVYSDYMSNILSVNNDFISKQVEN